MAAVRFTAPPVDDGRPARVLAFGAQVDTRVVRTSRRTDDPDRDSPPEQVAGYLAKYATKSATDTDHQEHRHLRRLHATARLLAAQPARRPTTPTARTRLLGKWAPMLGFRGTSPPSPAATP